MSKASDARLRRLRQAAQLLHRPRGKNDPVDVVRHLVGMQAQVPSSTALGIRARTKGLVKADVDRARFEDRSIVWTWAMRGTLHFVVAEDLPWLHPLVVESSIPNAHRRLVQEGVPAGKHEEAVKEIRRILKRSAPLTRPQLAERLRRKEFRTAGQAIAHLVWLAAAEGVCCYGPELDGEPAFVLMDEWVGPRKPVDREAALKELALRYMRSHGPATVEDLVAWSGIKMGDARRAWAAIEDRSKEVEAGGAPLRMLKSQEREAPPGLVRLLPAFDEYVLGWKDRAFFVSPHHWKKINSGGGWLHPVVLADGRAEATWSSRWSSRTHDVDLLPFLRLSPTFRTSLSAEVEAVREFLSRPGRLEGKQRSRMPT